MIPPALGPPWIRAGRPLWATAARTGSSCVVIQNTKPCTAAPRQEDAGKLLASLTGFLAHPGYVPEDEDDWYFDVFDMRSQHAHQAFQVLVDAALIAKALKVDSLSEEFSAIAIATACWSTPRCAVLALD